MHKSSFLTKFRHFPPLLLSRAWIIQYSGYSKRGLRGVLGCAIFPNFGRDLNLRSKYWEKTIKTFLKK